MTILKRGVAVWNSWREENPYTVIALGGAVLQNANLDGINLSNALCVAADFAGSTFRHASLSRINLTSCHLFRADFTNANMDQATCMRTNFAEVKMANVSLKNARLSHAYFRQTDLSHADLTGANLSGAKLETTDLSDAILTDSDLQQTTFVETNCDRADLSRAKVYGISVWDIKLDNTSQDNLLITPPSQPAITVDNIEVAQFIYLILNNRKLREVIDTITSKVVLILGRFTPDRKKVLDALRQALRFNNYLPVLFDFEKPVSRDLTETISTLAHMSRFIIADITSARSIPQELMAIVPNLPSVPVLPLIDSSSDQVYGMFEHIERYPSVLKPVVYKNSELLISDIQARIIIPIENKVKDLSK